jgi:hypothetical protein
MKTDLISELFENGGLIIYKEKNDLMMIDNKRFMHGRGTFEKEDPRDILTVQTARSSFEFCSDTRPIDSECPI